MQSLTFTCPDDWHLHVRDDRALNTVVPHSARQFARAIIMPNLKPPITTAAMALAYRRRILEAVPEENHFEPLMTLYLTESTTHDDVRAAAESPYIHAFKLYPAGATTHSDAGVKRLDRIFPILETMQRLDLPLLVHGEKTDPEIDLFDREKAFIDDELTSIIKRFPAFRIVFEHATTRDAVQFVTEAAPNIAATITPQHLLYNRNALFEDGIRPHRYCLPILKRETYRKALIAAATGESRKFFLGTDSAPHPQQLKESSCGCAGCYTAHAALELYAELFEKAGALDKLEGFASFYGPDFYRLPRNSGTITLEKRPWQVPAHYPFADQTLIPLKAGECLAWKCIGKSEAPPAS
jgi:dihydroorotase